MVYSGTMGDQPNSRGVYTLRRILAVLVILLLLALLVPQACQALLEPRDETGPRTQDTASVVSSGEGGSRQAGVSNEESAGVIDQVAEQKDAFDNPSYSSETGASETGQRTFSGAGSSEDEAGGEEDVELQFELIGAVNVLEEGAVGEVGQVVPTSVGEAGEQQAVEPQSPVEPMVPVDLTASADPTFLEGLLTPQDTTYLGYYTNYDDPVYYDDLTYYDGSAYYYDDLTYYDDSAYYYDSTYYGDPAYEEYLAAYEEYLATYSEYLAAYEEYLAANHEQQSS
jgi:hypothetical protein